MSTYQNNQHVTTDTSLVFNISVASDGKSITINETTGVGSGGYSPGGTAVITNITESFLRVNTPSGTEYDIDMKPSVGNVYDIMPSADGIGSYTITMADLGGAATDVFPDGMYIFRLLYKITGLSPDPGFIPPTVVNGAALSISEGYVHGLLAQLKPGCTCKNADFITAKLGWMYLKAAAYSAICDKPDKVNDYVNQIAKITGNSTGCISC